MGVSNSRKFYAISFIAVLVVFIFFAFSLLNSPGLVTLDSGPQFMKVGYLPVLVNLPLFVALEEGYFEKHGLQVEAVEAQSPNHIIEGIISGNLDGAGILALPILFVSEEKNPGEIEIFATTDETSENFVASILVREDSGIETIEDLKGKKIGVYKGLVQVLFLKGILVGMGFDPEKDVELVEIAPRMQLQGLEAGHYDALSTVEPFPTIAAQKNIGRVLIENPRVKYIQNPFPSVATPISADFIKKNPAAVKSYLRAYEDAISFIEQHPEEAKRHLAKYTPISEDVALEIRFPKFNHFGTEDRDNIQKYADWMHENGLLGQKIDVYSMFGSESLLE